MTTEIPIWPNRATRGRDRERQRRPSSRRGSGKSGWVRGERRSGYGPDGFSSPSPTGGYRNRKRGRRKHSRAPMPRKRPPGSARGGEEWNTRKFGSREFPRTAETKAGERRIDRFIKPKEFVHPFLTGLKLRSKRLLISSAFLWASGLKVWVSFLVSSHGRGEVIEFVSHLRRQRG